MVDPDFGVLRQAISQECRKFVWSWFRTHCHWAAPGIQPLIRVDAKRKLWALMIAMKWYKIDTQSTDRWDWSLPPRKHHHSHQFQMQVRVRMRLQCIRVDLKSCAGSEDVVSREVKSSQFPAFSILGIKTSLFTLSISSHCTDSPPFNKTCKRHIKSGTRRPQNTD